MSEGEREPTLGESRPYIRPFKLRDIPRLYRLGRTPFFVDQETVLVRGYSPLKEALRSWPGVNARTFIATGPLPHEWYTLQMIRRNDRPEWQITLLASNVPGDRVSPSTWQALLEHALREVVQKGGYRVYTCLPTDHPLVETFQRTGFRPYTKERIYTSHRPHIPDFSLAGELRPLRPHEEWELRRLWQQVTPQVVMAAEGLNGEGGMGLPYTWAPRSDQHILIWQRGKTFGGAVAVRTGERGHRLRFLLSSESYEGAEAFIYAALQHVMARHRGPLYVVVPEYIGGVHAPLLAAEFTPTGEQACLVRYLALPLRADATVPQSVLSFLEIGGEPAFTQAPEWPMTLGDQCPPR